MRKKTANLFLLLITVSTTVSVKGELSADNGKVIYDKWCTPCHGVASGIPGHDMVPGTAALSVKYKGALPAVLEQRTDLAPEFIRTVVRNGLFGMPITRRTEINDAELEDIIAFLLQNQKR